MAQRTCQGGGPNGSRAAREAAQHADCSRGRWAGMVKAAGEEGWQLSGGGGGAAGAADVRGREEVTRAWGKQTGGPNRLRAGSWQGSRGRQIMG